MSDVQAENTNIEKAQQHGWNKSGKTTLATPDAVGCDPGDKSCFYVLLWYWSYCKQPVTVTFSLLFIIYICTGQN